jgi:3-dehydroquinate dehydratase / shikimate dehydrogenase
MESHTLFLSISDPDLLSKIPPSTQAVELRLDLFPKIDLAQISSLITALSLPVLLTLRKQSHGGKFTGSEEERLVLIKKLLSLRPSFFDLEYDMEKSVLFSLITNHPSTNFILSYHNFTHVPKDLQKLYEEMAKYPAYCYKIAAFCDSAIEALQLLFFAKSHAKVSAICLGESASFARVLGPIFGNSIGYAAFDQPTAVGQLSHQELIETYHYQSLSPKTALYGLIGDPITHSIGPIYHNAIFRKKKIDAVYIKMRVSKKELTSFIPLAKKAGFLGLSVTTPLKEAIFPFIFPLDPSLQATNTLLFHGDKIYGTNTDGKGALDAIEKITPISHKTIVVLGAGGAGKAISLEAKKRGAHVIILNRDAFRANDLARKIGAQAGSLEEIPSHYDILINTTSSSMPISREKVLPSTLVMDINYHKHSSLLQEARLLNCQTLDGKEMFFCQAALQSALWLP